MTTISVQHHGNKVVSVAGVPTTDAALSSSFQTRGGFYTREVSAAEVARMYPVRAATTTATTADTGARPGPMTPSEMNKRARAHFGR